MPDTWEEALRAFCYPVALTDFEDAHQYPNWFEEDVPHGDLCETKMFEDRFRRLARYELTAWYEVVYWKMYRMDFEDRRTGMIVRDQTTRQVINRIGGNRTAELLRAKCDQYMRSESLKSFIDFQKMLVSGSGVAIAATFPAFLDPQNFPIVDKHVATWAACNGQQHSYAKCGGPDLFTYQGSIAGKTIEIDHWRFVESWYAWCRFTAKKLSELSNRRWRARDVEMAVFTVQRNRRDIDLTPLCGL